MMETKKWYQSKTIWGSIVTVLAVLLSIVTGQHVIIPEEQAQLVDKIVAVVDDVGVLVGVILTIYGRVKAEKRIN